MRRIVVPVAVCAFILVNVFLMIKFHSPSVTLRDRNAAVKIVLDYAARSQEAGDFFRCLAKELEYSLVAQNGGLIDGFHQIVIVELAVDGVRNCDRERVIYVVLDERNPIIINRQEVSCLGTHEAMQIFVVDSISKFFRIFCPLYPGNNYADPGGEGDYGQEPVIVNNSNPNRVPL